MTRRDAARTCGCYLLMWILQAFLCGLGRYSGHAPDLILSLTLVMTWLYPERPVYLALGGIFTLIWDIAMGPFAGAGLMPLVCACLIILAVRWATNLESGKAAAVFFLLAILARELVFYLVTSLTGAAYSFAFAARWSLFQVIPDLIVCGIIWAVTAERVRADRRRNWFRY